MEANILKKVLFINLFYFVVSIGIATHSIIMDVAFVIETAERQLCLFHTYQVDVFGFLWFHFVMHLFFIY